MRHCKACACRQGFAFAPGLWQKSAPALSGRRMPASFRPVPLLALCVALLAAACAEQPRRAAPNSLYHRTLAEFQKADTDHDEQLTADEFKAGLPELAEHFDEIDTDGNGKVNFAELWSYVQYRYVRHQQPPRTP